MLDFVDPDIEAKLAELEKEEDALAAAAAFEVCVCSHETVLTRYSHRLGSSRIADRG